MPADLYTAASAQLIEARTTRAAAGTVRRFDMASTPLPADQIDRASTHEVGLVDAIKLARVLAGLPPYCIVSGIERGCFAMGAPLRPAVPDAAADVARRQRTHLVE